LARTKKDLPTLERANSTTTTRLYDTPDRKIMIASKESESPIHKDGEPSAGEETVEPQYVLKDEIIATDAFEENESLE
jgi:hypothetical protein